VAKAMAAQGKMTPKGKQQGGKSAGLQLNIMNADASHDAQQQQQPAKDWPPFKVSQQSKGQQQGRVKAPGSAPAKLGNGINKPRGVTPGSVKRMKAADLFSS
jgi:hypothetical protein